VAETSKMITGLMFGRNSSVGKHGTKVYSPATRSSTTAKLQAGQKLAKLDAVKHEFFISKNLQCRHFSAQNLLVAWLWREPWRISILQP